jgi:hypothetical protein
MQPAAAAQLRSTAAPPPLLASLARQRTALRCVGASRHRVRAALRCAASLDASAAPTPLPLTAREQIEQAAAAARAALAAGASGRRQRVELLLPTNQRAQSFTNTDALDYPASAETIYSVACACADALLKTLSPGAELRSRRIGDASDPCGIWTTADGAFAVVVTPAAEHLPAIRKLAETERTALFILNPQWNEAGQARSAALHCCAWHAVDHATHGR